MKVIVALLAFAVVAVTANQLILNDAALERVKGISKACQEKSHVDDNSLKSIRSNNLVENDKTKDYFHCVFTEMNWVNGGSFNTEGFKADLKHDLPFDVIEPCNRFRSTGPQLSYNIYKCVNENVESGYQAHL